MRTFLILILSAMVFFFVQQPKPVATPAGVDCTTSGCHEALVDVEFAHEAAVDDCESCHEQEGDNHPDDPGDEFAFSDEPPDLCYMCHDEKNTLKVVHEPVADGDCTTCHSPHGSSQPFMLEMSGDEIICADCHDTFPEDEHEVVHGPVAGSLCTDCHNPHESDERSLLKAPEPDLCYTCHEEKSEQQEFRAVHSPFEDGCFDCHEPHASAAASLLLDAVPTLCYDCHDDVEEGISEDPVVHRGLEGDRSCLTCHNPHAAQHAKLLPADPPTVCFDCHDEKGEERVRRIREKVMSAAFAHPPAEDGDCTECHKPHSSELPKLLAYPFPSSLYATGTEDTFALCFECHDSELLTERTTDDATEFRTGTTNLHFVHVSQEKGRSCILCHDVHGAPNDHLIANAVAFGSWQMPIRFKPLENGGSCYPGCHEKRTYRTEVADAE